MSNNYNSLLTFLIIDLTVITFYHCCQYVSNIYTIIFVAMGLNEIVCEVQTNVSSINKG